MRSVLFVLFSIAAQAAGAVTPTPQGGPLWESRIEDAGVQLRVGIQAEGTAGGALSVLPAGRSLSFELTVQDVSSGTALRGLRPRVWLARQTGDKPEACTDQVRRFLSGRFMARADKDLNGWQILTLNGDGTLSVINPQLNVGSTRLESLVTLPGPGAELHHLRSSDRVLVTLPAQRELAVVDLGSFRVVQRIALGAGEPRRMVVSPDERTVYVAMDQSPRLVSVDLVKLQVVAEWDIGDGLHGLAQSDDGQRVVATSTSAGQVTVLDTARGTVLARHAVADTPLAVAWSSKSRQAYVASVNGDRLTVIDGQTGQRQAPAPWGPRTTALRMDPSGRWLMGVDGRTHRAWVHDTASAKTLGSIGTVNEPDQVVFTRRFAYVRGLGSLAVNLIDLEALGRGELAATEVPMYQRMPNAAAKEIGTADMIVPLPEGSGVLVANGADTAIYSYMEGMQAPQGSYQTYSRSPRAVAVVDRSLLESSPGRFQSRFRFDQGGSYSLAILIDQPRVVQCVSLQVDDTGLTPSGQRVGLRYDAGLSQAVVAGEPTRVRVHLFNPDAPGEPALTEVADLQVMALELPGVSQQRVFLKEVAPGTYEATLRFPRPGTWRLMSQVASKGLRFERAPMLEISVRAPTGGRK